MLWSGLFVYNSTTLTLWTDGIAVTVARLGAVAPCVTKADLTLRTDGTYLQYSNSYGGEQEL